MIGDTSTVRIRRAEGLGVAAQPRASRYANRARIPHVQRAAAILYTFSDLPMSRGG